MECSLPIRTSQCWARKIWSPHVGDGGTAPGLCIPMHLINSHIVTLLLVFLLSCLAGLSPASFSLPANIIRGTRTPPTGLSDYTQGLTRINKQSSRSKPAPPRGYPHECVGDCGKSCLDPEGVPFPEGKGTLTHHDRTNLWKTLLGSKINKRYLKCLQASTFLLKMSQPPSHGP